MNDHDTEKMVHLLLSKGMERIQDVNKADIVIVNTCCIREKAEQKFYSLMGRLRKIKLKKRDYTGRYRLHCPTGEGWHWGEIALHRF